MDKNKTLNILKWCGTVVCAALAVVCGIFAANSEKLYTQIVLIIVAVLFVALAAMVGYLSYLDTFKVQPSKEGSKKRALNYFLNANGKKKGIAIEDLTFEIIDKQMNNYIIDVWGTPMALWKNNIFSAGEDVFGKEEAFKILVAYKMISDLQMHHSKKVWKMFFELPDVDFGDIQECLVRNGDDELARALNMYRLSGEACVGEAAAFLDENASYIQRRMLNYVTRKINLFDM